MKKEKFLKQADKVYEWMRKARTSTVEYLKEVLEKQPDKRIKFDIDNEEYLTITYDGGRHPEYGGNICSQVNSVFIHPEYGLCVDIEDSNEYEESRIDTLDLIDIAEKVCNYALPRLEEERGKE